MIEVANIKIGIVVSKFNQEYTEKLLEGALDTLKKSGLDTNLVKVVHVPGAFEIPLAAQNLAKSVKYDAIIALGAVIRGDTYHFELVCDQAAAGIQQVSLTTGVPVIFGLITTENDEQALARTGGKEGNKGSDAALAALDMIAVMRDER